MEEKNIIEKTKEVKEIAKELQKIYINKIIPFYSSMKNILSFLTLPINTRFVENYHVNYAMLVNQKVTVPDLPFEYVQEQFGYTEWVCEQLEKAKKVLKDYQMIISKIYRVMLDYIIIEDTKEIEKILEDSRTKLEEIIKNPIIDVVCKVSDVIKDVVKKSYKLNETKKEDFEYFKYMEEIVDTTIKKFPAILQQDTSQVHNAQEELENIIGYDFGYIELDLEDYNNEN